jgi:hypothetical protein
LLTRIALASCEAQHLVVVGNFGDALDHNPALDAVLVFLLEQATFRFALDRVDLEAIDVVPFDIGFLPMLPRS